MLLSIIPKFLRSDEAFFDILFFGLMGGVVGRHLNTYGVTEGTVRSLVFAVVMGLIPVIAGVATHYKYYEISRFSSAVTITLRVVGVAVFNAALIGGGTFLIVGSWGRQVVALVPSSGTQSVTDLPAGAIVFVATLTAFLAILFCRIGTRTDEERMMRCGLCVSRAFAPIPKAKAVKNNPHSPHLY